MKQEEMKKLVEKFFAGETTAREESQLKSRLQSKDVPDELKAVRRYFDAMRELEEEKLDASFGEVLMNRITSDEPEPKNKLWIYTLASVAAAIALLLAVWMGTDLLKPKEVYGTVSNPKIAFAETKKILLEVSAKLNDGLAPAKITVNMIEENIIKAGDVGKINEALQKAGTINKLEKANEFLKPLRKNGTKNGNS